MGAIGTNMRAIKASTLGHCLTSLCSCIRNLLVKKRLFCIAVTLLGYFVLFLGCSRPLSSIEEEFLGSWGATLTDEQGVEVLIVWKFVFEYDTRRVVFNEIYEDNHLVTRRKGEWHARESNNLRVVLDHENIDVNNNYENSNSAYDDDGFGELIGSIFGELLTAFTDDEYDIEYYRKGNELYLKWYDHEYQAYSRLYGRENSLTQ